MARPGRGVFVDDMSTWRRQLRERLQVTEWEDVFGLALLIAMLIYMPVAAMESEGADFVHGWVIAGVIAGAPVCVVLGWVASEHLLDDLDDVIAVRRLEERYDLAPGESADVVWCDRERFAAAVDRAIGLLPAAFVTALEARNVAITTAD